MFIRHLLYAFLAASLATFTYFYRHVSVDYLRLYFANWM